MFPPFLSYFASFINLISLLMISPLLNSIWLYSPIITCSSLAFNCLFSPLLFSTLMSSHLCSCCSPLHLIFPFYTSISSLLIPSPLLSHLFEFPFQAPTTSSVFLYVSFFSSALISALTSFPISVLTSFSLFLFSQQPHLHFCAFQSFHLHCISS